VWSLDLAWNSTAAATCPLTPAASTPVVGTFTFLGA
jgi:hypothetical protein